MAKTWQSARTQLDPGCFCSVCSRPSMEECKWVWKWETGSTSRPVAFCQNQAWWLLHTGWRLTRTLATHTHACMQAHSHVWQGHRHSCEEDSLDIVIEQVNLAGSFERERGIRVFGANCSKQLILCMILSRISHNVWCVCTFVLNFVLCSSSTVPAATKRAWQAGRHRKR